MPEILLPVHKTRRLALLGFRRAVTGDPDPLKPDLDDRGFGATEYGPVVGVREGDTVTVHLVRERIDRRAPLFVTSSNPAAASIPGSGALPGEPVMDVKIKGVAGQSPAVALIQVHHGSAGGPIVAQLGAFVYQPLALRIAPHVMNVRSSGGGATVAPTVVPEDVIARANDIWRPVGIEFSALATETHDHTAASAFTVTLSDVASIYAAHHTPNAINVFFLEALDFSGGFGLSRALLPRFARFGFTHPGVAIAVEDLTGFGLDAQLLGNRLAHELGHVLGLWHPEKANADRPRKDGYSRRMVMHPVPFLESLADWRDDLGYGKAGTLLRRGALITLKDLSQMQTDGEAATARVTAVNPY